MYVLQSLWGSNTKVLILVVSILPRRAEHNFLGQIATWATVSTSPLHQNFFGVSAGDIDRKKNLKRSAGTYRWSDVDNPRPPARGGVDGYLDSGWITF